MDEKRHFIDQICTLWMRIAFMDEKRRFMDQICTLWKRFALMDEKRIFYGKKKYQPKIGHNTRNIVNNIVTPPLFLTMVKNGQL